MKIYRTKKELLQRLWKDEKDCRYIERKIVRWEIIRRKEEKGWSYIIVAEQKDEEIKNLREENRELKKKIELMNNSDLEKVIEERDSAIARIQELESGIKNLLQFNNNSIQSN